MLRRGRLGNSRRGGLPYNGGARSGTGAAGFSKEVIHAVGNEVIFGVVEFAVGVFA